MIDKLRATPMVTSLPDELPYWLVIHRAQGFGPRRLALLRQQEPCLSNCFTGTVPRPDFIQWCQQQGLATFVPDWQGVERDLAWAQQLDCHIVSQLDPSYPLLLREIASPPPVLYIKGDPACLLQRQLAIVGSRHPSAQGRATAYQFGLEVGKAGFVVTSGLAVGIDTASHEGALAAAASTVAVMGCGLDRIYPAQNKSLAQTIAQVGALVAEFPLGTPPLAAHFPQRNRIISGLSLGVIVIEAAMKSGSLMTANYALEQGREVFAVPGSILNPMVKGCHHLIRQGAKCVESLAHILEELPPQEREERINNKGSSSQLAVSEFAIQEVLAEKPLLAHIEDVCTPLDVVVARSGLAPQVVCSMLLDMELQGWVASVPGGYVRVMTGEKRL